VINKRVSAILALPLALLVNSAQAVSIGGYEVNAFATSLDGIAPAAAGLDVTTIGGTLAAVTTDTSVDSYVFLPTGKSSSSVALTLGFVSGSLVNGAGDDLVLFEIGAPDNFSVTIGGTNLDLATSDTGFQNSDPAQLNAVAIDLSAFGVANGAVVTQVTVGFNAGGATFALAGALAPSMSPVPVPAAVWLFGSGLLGLAGFARRRK